MVKKWLSHHETTLRSLALGLPLAFIVAELTLTGNSGAVNYGPRGLMLIALMTMMSVGATLAGVLAIMGLTMQPRKQEMLREGFLLAVFSANLAGLQLVHILAPIDDVFYLVIVTLINAGMVYTGIQFVIQGLSLKEGAANPLITIAWIAAVVLCGLMEQLSNNLLRTETALVLMAFLREAGPLITAAVFWRDRAKNASGEDRSCQYRVAAAAGLNLLALAGMIALDMGLKGKADSTGISVFGFHNLSLLWMVVAWFGGKTIHKLHGKIRENEYIASLPTAQARRFLLRYAVNEATWAATVGMRTVNFMVDHDPYEDSSTRLTASLAHIRREEIERYIEPVLSEKLLYKKVIGNQIYGTVDPEYAIRPCIDVLVLFSCVYLDAVPLIERRLKNLTSLFPIIDPDLAISIGPRDIEIAHARMEWLFYFDYDWIDQQIVGTLQRTNYGVNVNNLRLSTRNRILSFLQDKNRMGNFIWLSEEARLRLMMEAPYLANIVEHWALSPEETGVKSVHFIRFEELIPRIQKYFSLEESRKVLRDYDVSSEGQKLLNVLDLHIAQADSLAKLEEIVGTMEGYTWHGFRERDLALRLTLKAFERCQQFYLKDNLRPEQKEQNRLKFKAAVESIGYPGQLLYKAHMDKRSIRVAEKLEQICFNPGNKRFVESWLFLATLQGQYLAAEELQRFMNIIAKAIENREVNKHPVVKQKAFEAFFNLAPHLTEKKGPTFVQTLLNRLALYLIYQKAEVPLCCFFIDAKVYLEDKTGRLFPIEEGVLRALGDFFNQHFRRFGEKSSQAIALTSRWRLVARKEPFGDVA